MFSKIGRLAEGLATSVATSRRGFLGRVGRSALGVAGALGAVSVAVAAGSGGVVCCTYQCSYEAQIVKVCLPKGSTCPDSMFGIGARLETCYLTKVSGKGDCSKC
jgi:hypothetical protein